ncbi:MAG: prepilin peptidase [Pirellulales bacterium]
MPFFLLIFTARLGSFLHVLVCRIPLGKSVASINICCPRCKQILRYPDNEPVLRRFLLQG